MVTIFEDLKQTELKTGKFLCTFELLRSNAPVYVCFFSWSISLSHVFVFTLKTEGTGSISLIHIQGKPSLCLTISFVKNIYGREVEG